MPSTSPGYSITIRVEVPAVATATAGLTSAVGSAGGALTALDVVESQTDRMVVDVTVHDLAGVGYALSSLGDHPTRITDQWSNASG